MASARKKTPRSTVKPSQPELSPNLVQPAELPIRDHHYFNWRFYTTLIILVGLSLGFAGFSRVIDPSQGSPSIGNSSLSFFQHIGQLVENQDQPIKGEAADQINILLLGIGGAGHEGAYLADTIILVSLKPSTGQVSMLSIPRDFYVPIPNHDWRKINSANAFGREDDYPGGGEQLTADILSRVLDIDIPYYARVDFAGFTKLVNDLGGITVNVDKGFVDTQYPTENFGYQTISFKAGLQAMDGERALKFVRSRKSTSDFDRSRRQQQTLVAVREKALSFGTLLNPVRISDVLSDLGSHTKTNLEVWEMIRLAGLIEDLDPDTIANTVLDSGNDSPLQADSTQDGAYILRPRAGWDDWSDLQNIAAHLFDAAAIAEPTATVVVQNGTKEAGLADRTGTALTRAGFETLSSENAADRNQASTLIVDLSNNTKPGQLARLSTLIPNAAVVSTVPLYLEPDTLPTSDLGTSNRRLSLRSSERPDFLIVIGSDNAVRPLLAKRSSGTKKK
jgi:LCP family protein required for cell wall assembly